MRAKVSAGVPEYPADIYTTDAIIDPYPHYTRLREQGPVVWLSRHRLYALPRYTECKAVLRDDKTFVSGDGVALNRITNRLSRGTTLTSDGTEHDQRRKLVAHRLLPRALRAIDDIVDRLAADVVKAALGEVRSTASAIWPPRCHTRSCPTSSAGRATNATTFWPGVQRLSTSSAR